MARDNWHFDGYITSDCDADAGVFGSHHYTATAEETVRDVLQAGVDVDCGTFVQSTAASALNQSLINETLIETRIANLFRVRFRLGHFDPPGESETNARRPFVCARTSLVSKQNKSSFAKTGSGQPSVKTQDVVCSGPLDQIPRSVVANDYATQLSLDGAAQSSVLLKNSNQTLPWDRDKVGTVAVIGANSETAKLVSRCGLLMETDRLSRQARDSHNQDEGNLSGCLKPPCFSQARQFVTQPPMLATTVLTTLSSTPNFRASRRRWPQTAKSKLLLPRGSPAPALRIRGGLTRCVRKRRFCANLTFKKSEYLPKQARDNHRTHV